MKNMFNLWAKNLKESFDVKDKSCLDAAEGVPVSAWQNFVFEANTLKSCVLLTVIWKHHWFGLFQLGLRKSLFCTVKMAHCAEKAYAKKEGQRIISFGVKLFL